MYSDSAIYEISSWFSSSHSLRHEPTCSLRSNCATQLCFAALLPHAGGSQRTDHWIYSCCTDERPFQPKPTDTWCISRLCLPTAPRKSFVMQRFIKGAVHTKTCYSGPLLCPLCSCSTGGAELLHLIHLRTKAADCSRTVTGSVTGGHQAPIFLE